MLTEPNGIVLTTLIYARALDDIGGKGHPTKVVLDLLDGFLDRGIPFIWTTFIPLTWLSS